MQLDAAVTNESCCFTIFTFRLFEVDVSHLVLFASKSHWILVIAERDEYSCIAVFVPVTKKKKDILLSDQATKGFNQLIDEKNRKIASTHSYYSDYCWCWINRNPPQRNRHYSSSYFTAVFFVWENEKREALDTVVLFLGRARSE